ncbi:error-prone DNA polymerase [Vulcaniibacterium tengchongense]|uniref:Error-prone DNA polymerase n=1 Tax=Vulcaniibacterium tengchongense TaxID=1273429 RepID=A0A3N4W441_9GAMM|nr:error-prone DNA polymerase [Vulcaniibacterium tengchongense]RPE79984.1 error-prone DNA polymerase [Vulcaniibacterium tengchongense]
MSALPDYAELHCLSAFSFQRGASVAEELFERARQQGYAALAITDECSLAGIVRAYEAAKKHALKLIVGSEIAVEAGPKLVLLAADVDGYVALCRLITVARRRAGKGAYRALREDFDRLPPGLLALWVPPDDPDDGDAAWLQRTFAGRLWIAVELHRGPDDDAKLQALRTLGRRLGLPLVAAGDVHMHVRSRRRLQDTLTAIRHRTTVAAAGALLFPNGERHLRTRRALSAIYPADLLAETVRIAGRCSFALDQLKYQYPHELVPAGETALSWLRKLTYEGARERWPGGVPDKARRQIEAELELIAGLEYESYFLTVHDIVRFAKERGILCQGRGSAANSTVCYALGVTALDPDKISTLFERFISRERKEPPDIDIDFEHERREEVLQYVFERYGRGRAALVAVAISYRGKSAIRDVARALGLPPDQVDELAKIMERWSGEKPFAAHLRERGFDPDAPVIRQVLDLTAELIGFPRHLSQHPGGFVISEHPLHTLVPVENAAMDGRTVIQWDKDDLDVMGVSKVDCLALGMLTALRKTLGLLRRHGRRDLALAAIPQDDPDTYAMISEADTVGVFQIESRAQMAMLPRLRPKDFYDLVIEVAIVRPGPIQGDMVHPYLRRRKGEEPIEYPPALKDVFGRTLGVPLFQEQVMQLAIQAADYTPGEADRLRRSMAAWKRHGGLEPHRERLIGRMVENGYGRDYAERIFRQIEGFGSYGFPESHAASFALLAYASSWLKRHEPAAFACGLINSQPMGFYTPDQILQDVRRPRTWLPRGVRVLPVDVRFSEWDCTLEWIGRDPAPAIRLGLRLIQGFDEESARRIGAARAKRAFADVADLCERAALDRRQQALLADAGALKALAGHRHRARWTVAGVERRLPLLGPRHSAREAQVALPMPSAEEDVRTDYAVVGTTLGKHPLTFLRKALRARGCLASDELANAPHGHCVKAAGLVRGRQQPQTASGVIFVTLEDEAGAVNVVVWNHLAQRQRRVLLESQLLVVEGRLERVDGVQHLIAKRLENGNRMLGALDVKSRDFR